MVKSAILSIFSILVLSSAFPQSAQNQTLQTVDENRDLELTTNSMSPKDFMVVDLFSTGSGLYDPLAVGNEVSNHRGTFNIKPNICYPSPIFAAVKMSGPYINKGAFIACTEANCGGLCYIYNMSLGSSINELWNIFGSRWAISYSWVV